jgi:nucleoside-diphosphate-sugar epimerase
MCDIVRKYPVLPLVGGGSETMYLISVSDLCRAVSVILSRSSPAEFNLYYAETPTLRDVLKEISRVLGRRRVFLPVPAGVLLAGLTVANALGLRPGVDRDNLRSFRKSQQHIHVSNLSSVLADPQTVQLAIAGLAS